MTHRTAQTHAVGTAATLSAHGIVVLTRVDCRVLPSSGGTPHVRLECDAPVNSTPPDFLNTKTQTDSACLCPPSLDACLCLWVAPVVAGGLGSVVGLCALEYGHATATDIVSAQNSSVEFETIVAQISRLNEVEVCAQWFSDGAANRSEHPQTHNAFSPVRFSYRILHRSSRSFLKLRAFERVQSAHCLVWHTPYPPGGGGAQQGGRGNWNSGNREPEWSGWQSVRMGGSDNKGDGLASQPRRYRVPGQPLLNRHQVGGVSRSPDGLFAQQEWEPIRGRPTVRGKRTYSGRPGQRVEEGTWAAQKHSEAGDGRPVDRGVWTAKTVKRPRQQPAHPQYANYWAPLTRKRHTNATFSTAPTHQLLGSANEETTPARALAAAADRKQQPDATCEGKNG